MNINSITHSKPHNNNISYTQIHIRNTNILTKKIILLEFKLVQCPKLEDKQKPRTKLPCILYKYKLGDPKTNLYLNLTAYGFLKIGFKVL